MLKEYFALGIDTNGCLTAIPQIIPGFSADPAAIPLFLVGLAFKVCPALSAIAYSAILQVNWEEEEPCFQDVATQISSLSLVTASDHREASDVEARLAFLAQAMCKFLLPPTQFATNGTVVQVTTLESLYRVFERC